METSILKSTKKILGIADDDTAFDLDIITHINAVFGTLTQLGVGPIGGFAIEDATLKWDSFLADKPQQQLVKTYVFLKVRMLFDPPTTSYLLAAAKEQIEQFEWRISVNREETDWVDPNPPTPIVPEVVP